MTSDIRKLQLIDTNILKNVVEILDRHHLNYYMIGGTLLGAIRHKGFIPWDDDMDIAMPRTDYELFLSQFARELPANLSVDNFKTNNKYKYYITRIENNDYQVREVRNQNFEESFAHVSIDIFPIDGTPNNKLLRKFYYFQVLSYRALISLVQKNNIDQARKRSTLEKLTIFVGTHLPIQRIFSANKLQYKIDRLLKKQRQNSRFAGTIMGAYRVKEIVPRKYFGEGKLYEFEGHMFRGPSDYDAYLKHMYGDYMKLPSREQRESKKHFEIIN